MYVNLIFLIFINYFYSILKKHKLSINEIQIKFTFKKNYLYRTSYMRLIISLLYSLKKDM